MSRLDDLSDEWDRQSEQWSRGGQHHDGISHGRAITYEACADQLREVLQWIPVTERLPEPDPEDDDGFSVSVLVYGYGEMGTAFYGCDADGDGGGPYWMASNIGSTITHWRPRPKGPEVCDAPCGHDECAGHGACLRQTK